MINSPGFNSAHILTILQHENAHPLAPCLHSTPPDNAFFPPCGDSPRNSQLEKLVTNKPNMKTQYALFERFELELPVECVRDLSCSGPVDDSADYWQRKIDLSHISDDCLAAELKEYGAWDSEELQDREANERRILWIAAGNIKENELEERTK